MRGLWLPLLIVVGAEVLARVYGIDSDSIAAPSAILVAGWNAMLDGTLPIATGQTLLAALGGWALGGGAGLVVAILFGLFAPLARLMRFTTETLRPIPSVAIIPVAMLVFGFGYRMEIFIVAFACFWPVMIIGQSAVAGIEPRLDEVGRALRLNLWARATKIVLPAALPRFFVAFRLAAGAALIVAVTVEIAVNPLGLGYDLMLAQQTLHPDQMFALLLWVGVVGWCLNAALLFMQRRWFAHDAAG
ncbi:MAG TPA: ABC transporter permease subunit [Stellaceae bacterium]|jgi:NitT/TauT family transport system permease protein|nr:ABC transporter permease subunit [Stellaceae bacterium]